MTATYTWSVTNLESNTSDGGVISVHWNCVGVDGDHSARIYGSESFIPDASADGFVAYNDITEDTALSWVFEANRKTTATPVEGSEEVTETTETNNEVKARMEGLVKSRLDKLVTPVTTTGTPWSTEEVA